MDVVITLINKDGHRDYFGASHFGYEDRYLKAIKILISNCISKDDKDFISSNLKTIDKKYEVDSDVFIDNINKTVTLCNGFVIKKGNDSKIKHVHFDRVDLLINETMTYDEFYLLYDFFLNVKDDEYVVINDSYIYYPQIS